jgi:hypothetical protein
VTRRLELGSLAIQWAESHVSTRRSDGRDIDGLYGIVHLSHERLSLEYCLRGMVCALRVAEYSFYDSGRRRVSYVESTRREEGVVATAAFQTTPSEISPDSNPNGLKFRRDPVGIPSRFLCPHRQSPCIPQASHKQASVD